MSKNKSLANQNVKAQPKQDSNQKQDLAYWRKLRLEKVKKLRELGIDPYPAKADRTHMAKEIKENFDTLEGKEVTVVGRLMSWREHGKLVFAHIQDDSDKIQLFIRKDTLEPTDIKKQTLGWEHLNLIDLGDFVQATGEVVKTRTGEISVLVKNVKLITKAIRPLPDKWHGIKDEEARLRRRYLDMVINRDLRERFKRRALFWRAVREFLDNHGFWEINIPVLELVPGGGDARPFVTYYNALDQYFYLRIAHELPLKRLLGAGFEKVYDIGPRFRNEGFSPEHLPEHIAMEWYWAYADHKDGMEFTKQMFRHIVEKVYGKTKFNIRGFEVDFAKEWEIIDFGQVIKQRFNVDIFTTPVEDMVKILKDNGVELEAANRSRAVDHLWKLIRKTIGGPAFLVGVPKYLSPLAKRDPENPKVVLRFQPIIAGSELANAWAELNDPIDQLERFVEQAKLRAQGDDEAQFLDIDFVEMLEWGMPPAVGFGMTERVFWFLEDVPAREGVPFPALRYEIDDSTKKIYKDILPYIELSRDIDSGLLKKQSKKD